MSVEALINCDNSHLSLNELERMSYVLVDGAVAKRVYDENEGGGSGLDDTDDLAEGSTNLYFTDVRVLETELTDIDSAPGEALAENGDTIPEAITKLNGVFNHLYGLLSDAALFPQTIKVHLSAAEIYTLNSNPVIVNIAAPGVGKMLVVREVLGIRNYITDPFDALLISVRAVGSTGAGASNGQFKASALIAGSGGVITPFEKSIVATGDVVYIEDTQLEIVADSDSANGDGSIDLFITYSIITL